VRGVFVGKGEKLFGKKSFSLPHAPTLFSKSFGKRGIMGKLKL